MKRLLLVMLIFLPMAIQAQHDEKTVDAKLQVVLEELKTDAPRQWDLPPFLENLLEFLGRGVLFFRILFFLFLAALVFFGIWKTIGFFMKEGGGKRSSAIPRNGQNDESGIVTPGDAWLAAAREALERREWALAIVILHKGSVEYLYGNGILNRKRDYTNREIFSLLGSGELSEPFRRLAVKAERIVFKGESGTEDEYGPFEESYRRHFA